MQDKILSVFYAEDRLPYKDASRTTHYPIVNGNVFNGANNVTTIRYYIDRIGGATNVTWVVVSKLPNGQIANEVLDSNNAVYDEELGEHYIEFEISSYYTTLKGDVYLSLNGYQGGVEVEQDEDTGIYSIYGTPTIQATGSIKIGINYAPQIVQGTHFTTSDLQQVLGLISDKANISDTIVILANITQADLSGYNAGQIFYDKATKQYYGKTSDDYIPYGMGQLKGITLSGSLTLNDFYITYGSDFASGNYSGGLVFVKVESNYAYKVFDITSSAIYMWSGNGTSSTTLQSIIQGTPSNEMATISYVSNNYVNKTQAQTISGLKTFTTLPQSSLTPTDDKDLTPRQYVDYQIKYFTGKLIQEYQYNFHGTDSISIVYNTAHSWWNNENSFIASFDTSYGYFKAICSIRHRDVGYEFAFIPIQNLATFFPQDNILMNQYFGATSDGTLTMNQIFNRSGSYIKPLARTSYVDSALATKQDKLIAGPNITISEDNVISATGGGGSDFHYEVVEELPDEGEENVIYLVPKTGGLSPDVYNEYIWVPDIWDYEFIGTTAVDLSNYVDLTNAQTITGAKTFNNTNGITIKGTSNDSSKWNITSIDYYLYFKNPADQLKMSIGYSNVSIYGANFLPNITNNADLGSSSLAWKDLYLSGKAYAQTIEDTSQIVFRTGNATRFVVRNAEISTRLPIKPESGYAGIDLGASGLLFRDLYLSGALKNNNASYGLALPDTTSYTENKTIATTSDLPQVMRFI